MKLRGGGGARCDSSSQQATVSRPSADNSKFELLWICASSMFVGALFHPPKPLYQTEALLNQLELNLDQIGLEFPAATVVLCGDFYHLSDEIMCKRVGLLSIVKHPTCHQLILDRIYVSSPIYSVIRIVTSFVRGDRNAVIAYTDQGQCPWVKTSIQLIYRCKTPSQHASFLQYSASIDFNLVFTGSDTDVQLQFDIFYSVALNLLDTFILNHLLLLLVVTLHM